MRVAAQKYCFPKDDIAFIADGLRGILETGAFLTMGKYCDEFENAFADYGSVRHAIAVSSGTAAIEIILRCLDVRDKEVLVPTNTFAATAFAVIHAGGIPVFCDCADDLTLDPEDTRRRITSKTAAIITVHIGGLVSPLTHDLVELAKQKGIPLVEDAAHAHGSILDGRHAGTFGVAGAFSFFSTKVMTTAEGGMIITEDPTIAEKARILRDQAKLANQNYHEEVGYNWRMSEVQALMGLSQLRRLDDFIKKRNEIADQYTVGLAGHEGIALLPTPKNVRHNYYKYIVFIKPGIREAVTKGLKSEYGVALGGTVYDVPCHEQPVFRPFRRSPLPRAEDLCSRHICPPIYPTLSDAEAQHVIDALKRTLS